MKRPAAAGASSKPAPTGMLAAWRRASLGDVVAGATVAATSLPQYIAYAELAGLPGHSGIRKSGPPLIAFALITGSPLLSVGVTSITALMSDATLGGPEYREAHGDDAWADLLGAFALLVGVASAALAVLGAARLASRIPGPVKAGWKLGFAATVIASQAAGAFFGGGAGFLKERCALPQVTLPVVGNVFAAGGAARVYRLLWMLASVPLWDPATVGISVLTLVMVFRGRQLLGSLLLAVGSAREPVAGLEVLLATAVGTALAILGGYAGAVVGQVSSSSAASAVGDADSPLSPLVGWVRQWPWEMPWAELHACFGNWPKAAASAAAFAAVNFLAIISVCESEGSWSPTRELAGQGLGCVVSGMVGSAPIGGSLSRSLVAKMTGASSPLAGLVSGLTTLALAQPAVAGLLAPTPKAVLAAVVLAAVVPGVLYPKDCLKLHGAEATVAWGTVAATVLLDPSQGFGAGILLHLAFRALAGGKRRAE